MKKIRVFIFSIAAAGIGVFSTGCEQTDNGYGDAAEPAVIEDTGAMAADSGQTYEYEVVAGDSLWKIARRHNTSVSRLKELNQLSDDLIHVGDKLIVPGTPPVESSSGNSF